MKVVVSVRANENESESESESESASESARESDGYLAHKKLSPHGNLRYTYAQGPLVVLGWETVSFERGTLYVGAYDLQGVECDPLTA